MLTAARAGDVAALSAALERDPTLVGAGFWYMPPLHFAVREGHLDAVRLLVAAGADLTHRNALYGNDTLLQMAVDRGHERVADYLRRELRSRLASAGSRHPIHAALAAGDMAAVERLLGADRPLANRGDHLGRRPLHYAVEAGRRDLVDLLLGAGADPNLPEGPNSPRGFALWGAARHGRRAIAELLLAAGADANAEVESSGTPTSAAEDADLRAVLYRFGGRLGLAAHFHQGATDTIAALLDAQPAMFDAAAAELGFTHCVASGHEGLLRLLLARGLRVPPMVTYCQTYLWRSLPLARLLLEHGMDPDLPNWQQIRPLHHQAGRGDIAAARLFLEFGADPDAVDEEFRSTPLGWAARRGQREFVQFLLARRGPGEPASVPARARAPAWAQRRGHREIAALLAAAEI